MPVDVNALDIYTRLVNFGGTVMWSSGGINFQATAPYMTEDGRAVGVYITAADSRGPLPTNNPYQFFNPFVNVVTSFDPKTGEIEVAYDAVLAFKQMVEDTVLTVAKNHGWVPA